MSSHCTRDLLQERIADREFLEFSQRFRRRIKDLEDYQVYQEVLDRSTLLSLYRLVRRNLIGAMGGVVSTGKEAHVFHAIAPDGSELAVKIYRVQTADLGFIRKYILGDPRFQGIKDDRRSLILRWARREHSNLIRASAAGVSVPRPIGISNNVLVMDFVGRNGVPAPTLKQMQSQLDEILDVEELRDQISSELRKLYWKAKLIHGDLSEYNIMYLEKPVLIDISQAVSVDHPMAHYYLSRDLGNLARFLSKYLPCTQDELMRSIIQA